MKCLIERLFCRHDYTLIRWHYTHGLQGNEPMHVEAELKCLKCGKLRYEYAPMDSAFEEMLLKTKAHLME